MTDVTEPWATYLSATESQMLTFPRGYSESHSHSPHPRFSDPGSVLTDRLLPSPPQLFSSGLPCKAFVFSVLLLLPEVVLREGQIALIEELLSLFLGQPLYRTRL